ncbi:MAG: thiamine-phosphate synthase family protein [Sulfolobales archaeon]
MIFPHSIIEKILETPVKALLARRLFALGYSQPKIGRILGISQPTVAMYLREHEYSEEEVLRKIQEAGVDVGEIERLVEEILTLLLEGDVVSAMKRLGMYGNSLLASLRLCSYHRRIDPRIPENCTICSEIFRPSEESEMLFELEKTVEMLSKLRHVARLVPEVGMNIAYAKRDSKDLNDILAYPGRIVRLNNVIVAVGKPTWGSSRHLGSILLQVHKMRSNIRAIANIKDHYCIDRWIEKNSIPHKILESRESITELDIIERVSKAFIESNSIVVKDLGGRGFEPAVYIVGENPFRIYFVIKEILELCRKSEAISQ